MTTICPFPSLFLEDPSFIAPLPLRRVLDQGLVTRHNLTNRLPVNFPKIAEIRRFRPNLDTLKTRSPHLFPDSVSTGSIASYMPSSCREIRAELAKCMQKSDCVLLNRHSVADCMKDKDLFDTQVPDECHRLRKSFFNCRRGLVCPCLMRICVDMRICVAFCCIVSWGIVSWHLILALGCIGLW